MQIKIEVFKWAWFFRRKSQSDDKQSEGYLNIYKFISLNYQRCDKENHKIAIKNILKNAS